jgi:hypothetical protein
MLEQFKVDLRKLLGDFPIDDNGIIGTENIVGYGHNATDKMYNRYKKPVPSPVAQTGKVIEYVKPFFQDFNIRRFWFKDSKNKIAIKEGETMAFQDGINIILKPGMYIDGGEAEGVTKEDRYKEFAYVYYPQKIKLAIENFYLHTYGEYLLRNANQPIIRFYFSLEPDKVKVRAFTDKIRDYFNERKIPFQYKTPHELANFGRGDTLVLYVAQNHYFYILEFIHSLIKHNKDILRENLPLFVKKIAEGVGFAEDPFFAGKDSFGEHRCDLIYDAINEIGKNNKSVSIDDIIAYTIDKGYNPEEFYRNPYTKFDYKFDEYLIEADIVAEMSVGRYYRFPYNRVALEYGLELMEKAVWLDKDTFTWFSYHEDENGGEKYYKELDEHENLEIFAFLDKLLKIRYNRSKFPNNVVRIIEEKIQKSQTSDLDNYKTNLKKVLSESKANANYENIWKNVYQINTSVISMFSKNTKNIIPNILIEREYEKIEENINEFLDSWDSRNITPEHIHKLNISELTNAEAFKEAIKIYYKFAKPNYPIANEFKNYEYCPGIKGKLQVGTIMLFVYCPSLYDEFE